ncbi:MAG TPA: hydrogen peroxide-dependent heme synthase [Candidatus Angelobacter sp.]|jgi:chlorite dismutase|nr:hydrogen peroxide-dependent heme synthase [Candidatus Angelobacter sp.]
MATTTKAEIKITSDDLHAVPLTLEGSSVLHQMFRFRWAEWRKLSESQQHEIAAEASAALLKMENDMAGQTALFSVLGHKGDLLIVHFRNSFDQLKAAELQISRLRLNDYLEQTTSYLSVVELGLYESSVKLYRELREKGTVPHSEEWNAVIADTTKRQTEAMRPRLFPQIPSARYICFYPMDRRRGEDKNWYSLPIEERQRQMEEHGLVGRRYAGTVRQIITGSIGFDDWEWGVDLFADDPLIFKKLIYEMRFDEVSAVYALFGTFYVGVRCPAAGLEALFSGKLPD